MWTKIKLRVTRAAGISWRTSVFVIVIVLQTQALNSAKAKSVTAVEGDTFFFKCEYPQSLQSNPKYLSRVDLNNSLLIWTNTHNQWETKEHFSLYDNTNGSFFIVKMDKLVPEDSGTYLCGVDISSLPDDFSVIQLEVSQELNMTLFLTIVMCVAALVFVCLFTLCLLQAVKHQRSGPHQNRETISDYETMMPSVGTEVNLDCTSSASNWADLPSLTPHISSHFASKQQGSNVTLGPSEYVDADVQGQICQYQHLDPSRSEEHVYHSLHGNSGPKDGTTEVKELINC